MSVLFWIFLAFFCLTSSFISVGADEGLWLFEHPPLRELQNKYCWQPSAGWLKNLQISTLRFNSGGSGAFVSHNGLILTNYHVVAEALAGYTSGYYARTPELEARCPGLEVAQLEASQDVTPFLTFLSPSQLQKKVDAMESEGDEVVNFYGGKLFQRYRFRKLSDLRLVFLPEPGAAYFGGDVDNFEYPRHCLDVAFLRAYDDNGKPFHPQTFLPGGPGVQEGDLVAVSGNPGHTERFDTVSRLEFLRDHQIPLELAVSGEGESVSLRNTLKARKGMLRQLSQAPFLEERRAAENLLRRAAGPTLRAGWEMLESAFKDFGSFYDRYYLLENCGDFHSQLFKRARDRVRGEEPTQETVDKKRELSGLTESFTLLQTKIGPDDPIVKLILAGQTPAQRAAQLVDNPPAMDELARQLEPETAQLRSRYQKKVAPLLRKGYALVAQAHFRYGSPPLYPEATFTPRLSFGTVRGYAGAAYATSLGGLFGSADRHGNEAPFQVPATWSAAQANLDLSIPLNFACDADVVGGQSGSPVVDRRGDWVGVIFDSNKEALQLDFAYTDRKARALAVDRRAILETLDKVYHCQPLLDELGGHR